MKLKQKHSIHTIKQRKIIREQNAYLILGGILRFQDTHVNDSKFSNERNIAWTISAISEHFGLEKADCIMAVHWLVMNDLLEHRSGQYYRTSSGEYAYHLASQASAQLDASPWEWKDEVLSGMDKWGDQTKIDGAALPATGKPGSHGNSEERFALTRIQHMSNMQKIADTVELPLKATIEGIADETIKKCTCCGEWKRPDQYWRKNAKNGQKLQSACIDCMKAKRKRSR